MAAVITLYCTHFMVKAGWRWCEEVDPARKKAGCTCFTG